MHADRPQAVSLFFSKVSVREKEGGRRRRGERKREAERKSWGETCTCCKNFFFNSFKMEIIKSQKRKENNFDQARKKKVW